MLVVSEGSWIIINNTSVQQTGVISRQNVLDSRNAPIIPYDMIHSVYGGNFWTGLKDVGSKIFKGVRKALPVIKEVAQVAATVLPLLGLGDDEYYEDEECYEQGGVYVGGRKKRAGVMVGGRKKGGVLVGGKRISRAELKKRLARKY